MVRMLRSLGFVQINMLFLLTSKLSFSLCLHFILYRRNLYNFNFEYAKTAEQLFAFVII